MGHKTCHCYFYDNTGRCWPVSIVPSLLLFQQRTVEEATIKSTISPQICCRRVVYLNRFSNSFCRRQHWHCLRILNISVSIYLFTELLSFSYAETKDDRCSLLSYFCHLWDSDVVNAKVLRPRPQPSRLTSGTSTVVSLTVPRHRLSTYGRRAFAVAGPTMFNTLPDDLQDPAVSTSTIRQSLKTHLFSAYQHV